MTYILIKIQSQVNIEQEQYRKKDRHNSFKLYIIKDQSENQSKSMTMNLSLLKKKCFSQKIKKIIAIDEKQLQIKLNEELFEFTKQNLQKIQRLIIMGELEIASQEEFLCYFEIAVHFQIKEFFRYLMDKKNQLLYSKEMVEILFKNYNYIYLKDLKRKSSSMNFIQWYIKINQKKFKLEKLQDQFQNKQDLELIIVELLLYKITMNTIKQSDIQDIIDHFSQSSLYQSNNYRNEKKKSIIPWSMLPLKIILSFKNEFQQKQFNQILKQKKHQLQNNPTKYQVNNELNEQVKLKKQQLDKVILEKGKAKFQIMLERLKILRPKQFKQSIYTNQSFNKQDKKMPQKQKKGSYKSQYDLELQQAIELSKKQNQKNQQSQNTKKDNIYKQQKRSSQTIQKNSNNEKIYHQIKDCKDNKSCKLQCGHKICLGCILNSYLSLTNDCEFTQNQVFKYKKVQIYKVRCFNCSKNLSENDVKNINKMNPSL